MGKTNKQKNQQISKTITATRQRRSEMRVVTYVLKITKSKCNREQKEDLKMCFLEAKWLYNSELSKGDWDAFDRNAKFATVKVGDKFETRKLTHLGSQMRQDVVDGLKQNIINLSKAKAKGHKVGRLKFKKYVNMVPLRQYGCTFSFDFDKRTVKIQKISRPFKVKGLEQIPEDAEIANAQLVSKPSGYYIHVTTYQEKKEDAKTGREIGIDFGIAHSFTTSDGDVYDYDIPETKSVKLSQRRMSKTFAKNNPRDKDGKFINEEKVYSKNYFKKRAKYRRACERYKNQKMDKAKKFSSKVLHENDYVAIQDELLKAWHKGLFGRQVQHSILGSVKALLKNSPKVHVVPSSFPSTQVCPVCGERTRIPLSQRYYECVYCGYREDSRDRKAASSILGEAHRLDERNGDNAG